MNNSRVKLFLENFLFYGGLQIITQIVPFIMLPIISKYLSEENYGIVNLYTLLVFFGTQLVGLGIWDAMYREYFEKKDKLYQIKVTSTSLVITIFSVIFFCIIISIFKDKITLYIFKEKEKSYLIDFLILSIGIGAIKSIVEAPIRMENKKRITFIIGFLSSVLNYFFIIMFIKLKYTFEAIIYSSLLLNIILLIIFIKINYKYFNLKKFNYKVAKELLKIGLPILPLALVYWVFKSSDKLMISKFLDIKEVGIYSIGSRVASISQLVSSAFSGGWAYFSYITMKDENQKEINSLIFESIGIIACILFILSLPFINIVFNNFFEGDYRRGAEVFPYLFLCPFFLLMNQTLSTQLLIKKKSYLLLISLSFGCFVNIILNYFLIKKYGIKGVGLSTLIGYFTCMIINLIVNIKNKSSFIKIRYIYILFLLWILILLLFFNIIIYKFFAIFLFINIIFIYFKGFYKLSKYIKGEICDKS